MTNIEMQDKWIEKTAWDSLANKTLKPESFKNSECFCGIERSMLTESVVLALLFPPTVKKKLWNALFYIFCPDKEAENEYHSDLISQGFIKTYPGDIINCDHLRLMITGKSSAKCILESYSIIGMGFDSYTTGEIAEELSKDHLKMVEVRKQFRVVSPAVKKLQQIIIDRKIEHDGNPIISEMISNVVLLQDRRGNTRPARKLSTICIDGGTALINAMTVSMQHYNVD